MNFKQIQFEEIDFDDEEFRISEDLDSALILDSVREIGQLNPVLLMDRKTRMAIVCGFRRIRAMRRLGSSGVIARLLPRETLNSIRTFKLALWDNLSHRQLNELEKARVLFKLKNNFGVSSDLLLKTYLPLLGLEPHENILNTYLALNGVRPELRRCLAEGLLTHSSLERLAKTPARVQDSIASLMAMIRLSASLQRKVLGILEELSAISGAPLDAPLHNSEVLGVLNDSRLSRFQRGEMLHTILHRLRNPQLSKAVEQFGIKRKRLGLPGSIRINPHPFFETTDLHIEFDASNVERFRELTLALQAASEKPELEELFQPD